MYSSAGMATVVLPAPGPDARASTRRSSDVVLGDPLAKRRVDARLPSATAGLEVLDHVGRKPDGGRHLRIGARRPASAKGRPGELLRPAIGGKVWSDVAFSWGRRAVVPVHWLSHADDPMRPVARRPDEDHHRGVEEPDRDEAVLSVVLPVVFDQSASCPRTLRRPGPCRVPEPRGWQCALSYRTRSAQFMLLQQVGFHPGSDLGKTTGAIETPESAKSHGRTVNDVGEDLRPLGIRRPRSPGYGHADGAEP